MGRLLLGAVVGIGLLAATLTGFLLIPHAPESDPTVIGILWLNAILAATAISVEVSRRPYSLHLFHLVCMFLFLGAASILQYTRGVLSVLGSVTLVEDVVLRAALSTTIWLTAYITAYELNRRRAPSSSDPRFLERPLVLVRVLLLGSVGLLALFYLAAAGLLGVLTRGAAAGALEDFSRSANVGGFTAPLFILSMNLARALPSVSLMAVLVIFLRIPGGNRVVLMPALLGLGFGTLLINNPFAATRMFFTTTVVAFAAPFLLRRFRTGTLAVVAIAGGLAILPAMGATRHAADLQELTSYFSLMSPLDYLSRSSDVDSLGMTALCQAYVDRFGIAWGVQLGAAFMFWVPRFFWPGKPYGTGTVVVEGLGGFEDNTNLSPPIQAEFLVNFGLVGVLVGGILFGLLLSYLDRVYWAPGRAGVGRLHRLIDCFYPFWLGCVVYFTRGDFLPAMTFTVSFSLWLLPLGFALVGKQAPLWRPGDPAETAEPPPAALSPAGDWSPGPDRSPP